jgi:hypothetical protein
MESEVGTSDRGGDPRPASIPYPPHFETRVYLSSALTISSQHTSSAFITVEESIPKPPPPPTREVIMMTRARKPFPRSAVQPDRAAIQRELADAIARRSRGAPILRKVDLESERERVRVAREAEEAERSRLKNAIASRPTLRRVEAGGQNENTRGVLTKERGIVYNPALKRCVAVVTGVDEKKIDAVTKPGRLGFMGGVGSLCSMM